MKNTAPISYSEFIGCEAPFMDHLGLVTYCDEAGTRVVALQLEKRHLNAAFNAHGGVMLALLDVAMGSASRLHDTRGRSTVTVEMKASFMRPGGAEGDLIEASGTVRHATHTLAFCEAELRSGNGELLATASGTFKYIAGPTSSNDG